MKYYLIFIILTSITLYSCGTSTGSRYGSRDTGTSTYSEKKKDKKPLKETFDIIHYKTSIEIEDTITQTNSPGYNSELWYGYSQNSDSLAGDLKIIKRTNGFRVLALATDDMDEADSVKSSIYFQTKKPVYIAFEPPFYKVKAGDFILQQDAADFTFQLTQLGFKESKVIRDTVNVYR